MMWTAGLSWDVYKALSGCTADVIAKHLRSGNIKRKVAFSLKYPKITMLLDVMLSAEFGACVFLIALGFIECSQTMLAVVLLTLGATVHGAVYSGFLVNCMDIAPQFAGTIFGISNMFGAATGFIAPPIAAALTPNVNTIA